MPEKPAANDILLPDTFMLSISMSAYTFASSCAQAEVFFLIYAVSIYCYIQHFGHSKSPKGGSSKVINKVDATKKIIRLTHLNRVV